MNYLPVDIYKVQNDLKDRTLALLKGDALTYMLHRDGVYEQHFSEFAKRVVKEGDCCVDMGANLGYHTITLANLVGNRGSVFAFEPQRITFQQLNCNIFLNKLDNVKALNCALGESDSFVHVERVDYYRTVEGYYGTNIGNTSVNFNSVGDQIPLVKLDSFGFQKMDFVKIDIQGSELNALRGAVATINAFKPLIFIEIEEPHLLKFNTNSSALIDFIKGLGYGVLKIDNEYPCDHICVPIGRELDLDGYGYRLVSV